MKACLMFSRARSAGMNGARGLLVGAIGAALLPSACGSEVGNSKDGGGGSTSSASAFAMSYCNLIQPCCANAGLPADGAQCQAFTSAFIPSVHYDSAAGEACLAAIQSSGDAVCSTLGLTLSACAEVITPVYGATPPGGPCTQSSDCAAAPGAGGGALCYEQSMAVDGGVAQTQTCVQTLVGEPGQGPCIGNENGLFTTTFSVGFATSAPPSQAYLCDEAAGVICGSSQTCDAVSAVGGTCTTDANCVSSAYCAFAADGSTCVARLADGSSCATATTACQSTSYCDSTSETCKPLLADGAVCSIDTQCASSVCTNGACSPNNGDLTFLCGTK